MKNSSTEGLIILAILFVVVLLAPKSPSNSPSQASTSGNGNGQAVTGGSITSPNSPHAKNISLSTGNGAYVYQSYEEYITLYNRGRDSVNITGWQLKNGKDRRAYVSGSGLQHFAADTAFVPQGTLFISPNGANVLQDIILEDGDTAILTTGSMGTMSPYRIVSFKENMCSGYLENMDEYSFTPALSMSCPRPANEPGVSGLDTECRTFINRMSSCRTPKFETRDRNGEICSNCVDGQQLSSSCVAFIKSHFNYNSCIANHRSNPDFSGDTWRVFLGKGWEMWAEKYETIEVFDLLGRLVTSRTY